MYRVQAEGVVPVPVGDDGQVRKRQHLPLQGPVEIFYMRGGVAGIHGDGHVFPLYIAEIRPVLYGIKWIDPCVRSDFL